MRKENDDIGGRAIVRVRCPLCGHAMHAAHVSKTLADRRADDGLYYVQEVNGGGRGSGPIGPFKLWLGLSHIEQLVASGEKYPEKQAVDELRRGLTLILYDWVRRKLVDAGAIAKDQAVSVYRKMDSLVSKLSLSTTPRVECPPAKILGVDRISLDDVMYNPAPVPSKVLGVDRE
jgi:hypothetical protein